MDGRHAAGMNHLAKTKPVDLAPRPRRAHLHPALEPHGEPFGKSGDTDLLSSGAIVIGNAEKRNSFPRWVEKSVARLVPPVARLAGGANDRQPLTVPGRRDGGAGHRLERHGVPARANVIEVRFMHVSAKNVISFCRDDAFFSLLGPGDVYPLIRRDCACVHEQNIVLPDGKGQTREEGALFFAKLCLRPGDRGLRAGIQEIRAAPNRGGVMIAEHNRAIGCVLFDQVKHRDRVSSVANQVAEKRESLCPQAMGVGEACVERLKVAVNIGEESQL